MARGFKWLGAAFSMADQLASSRQDKPIARLWTELRRRSGATPVAAVGPSEPIARVDPALLKESLEMLKGMLGEIDELARDLPEDAKPISIAARALVERSIAECQKTKVNASKLASDMQQVGQLALAMRERLLLSPWERKSTRPN